MPSISNKAIAMPASPIRRLVPYAEAAKNAGKTVYHLNIGQPDIETPANVLEKMKNLDLKVVEYSHSAGFQSYREGLANYYKKAVGVNLDPNDEIMVTTGGSEALVFAFQTCLEPGDEIIIPEPFYANYNGFAKTSNINVVPVTAKIENGFALPPIEEFRKKITPKTKGILICNPGNPTGYLYTKEELETLKEVVLEHDLFLFADEVYREFCYEGAVHTSALTLTGLEDNVILVDSVSKRYSMCGARVGALVSKNKEVMASALKFGQARLSPPTFGQIAGEEALNTPQSYFDHVVEEYVERRDILVDGLNQIEGVVCPKPQGAFYAIAKLPIDDADKFCQWLLEDFEYENQTVMMAPATGFYSTPGLGKQEVRLAYVLNKEALKNAVKCLEEALKVYPGRSYN
ncbi:pyridoxal phosphate-dependent aminotransferase [Parvicella tangerina]|uniref:Aminotransferase n=1 Tax=Parvicella tangerina TaxID=2829795 RepID=A0A916NHJ2_9FLAO|nr:pyridoxal phosphate-dependent aminotransferase [Parvicella tangerina]CAG5081572.1 Aspartate/prephenate aminotransferase [Parvicella tangerina]